VISDASLRRPAPSLQSHYREAGLWLDTALGAFFDAKLAACSREEVRVWSQLHPRRGSIESLRLDARRFAAGLRKRGVRPGDVVSYQLPNRIEALVTLYGAAMAGATLVPIVHFYGPREVRFILGQVGARVHVTSGRVGTVESLDALSGLPDLEHVVVVDEGGRPGDLTFDELLDCAPLAELPRVDPAAPALVGYTSGTTAEPKGVVHVGLSVLAEVQQLARYDAGGPRPLLTGAPLAHAMGMLGGALLPLVKGHPIHVIDRWDPERVLAIVLEADLSAGTGSPYFLTSLLDAKGFGAEHARRLERIGLGGAPVPGAIGDRAERLGISTVRSYGSTEHPTISGGRQTDLAERRKYTDGALLDGCEIRLVDPDGRDLPRGQAGEILSRGAELFWGYTDPHLTERAIDAQGWYHTEDVGVLDAEGFLTITDRKKDIIIRGGENISAAEVEELLVRIPGVAEVAVVAAPDERFGERACAFFRIAAGGSAPTLPQLREHLDRAGLARQKWPEEIRVIPDFARTPTGKIKKQALRDALKVGG
jgi:acyl-CoA synthetase (AMP-forming)/AMP-acid ligase II